MQSLFTLPLRRFYCHCTHFNHVNETSQNNNLSRKTTKDGRLFFFFHVTVVQVVNTNIDGLVRWNTCKYIFETLHSFLRISSHLVKKSLMEKFIFYEVRPSLFLLKNCTVSMKILQNFIKTTVVTCHWKKHFSRLTTNIIDGAAMESLFPPSLH